MLSLDQWGHSLDFLLRLNPRELGCNVLIDLSQSGCTEEAGVMSTSSRMGETGFQIKMRAWLASRRAAGQPREPMLTTMARCASEEE